MTVSKESIPLDRIGPSKSTSNLVPRSPSESRQVPKSRPSQLLVLAIALVVSLASVLTVLLALTLTSRFHDGLITVRLWSYVRSEEGAFSGQPLLWTTLPTLVFSLVGFLVGWVFKDVMELTPFLALYRGPVRGDRSAVLVDYRTEPRPLIVTRAARRGHWLVAALAAAMLVFAGAVVPLSAHLFETRIRRIAEVREGGARQVAGFSTGRLSAEADYGRAMEMASAREVYGGGRGGGELARWMAGGWVFPAFAAAGTEWPRNSTVTIVGATGYTAELDDCTFLEADKYRISELAPAGVNGTAVNGTAARKVSLNGADQGCLLKMDLDVQDGRYDVYFGSDVYQCSGDQKNGTRPSLFFTLAWPRAGGATANNSSLALSMRVLSCRPSYRMAVGSLPLSTSGSELWIAGFSSISTTSSWAPQAGFEKALLSTRSSSASAAGSRARVQTTAFGNLVLSRFDMTQRDPAKPWSENDVDSEKDLRAGLIKSTQVIFQSAILSALATTALDESKWPLGAKENLRTVTVDIDVERLFVFVPVAVVIMVALFLLTLLSTGAAMVSREIQNRNVSLPANMLAYHDLLHGCSDLQEVAAGVYGPNSPGIYRGFEKVAEEQWTVKTALFHIAVDGDKRKLCAEGLHRRDTSLELGAR